jgi:hypothetical protein
MQAFSEASSERGERKNGPSRWRQKAMRRAGRKPVPAKHRHDLTIEQSWSAIEFKILPPET